MCNVSCTKDNEGNEGLRLKDILRRLRYRSTENGAENGGVTDGGAEEPWGPKTGGAKNSARPSLDQPIKLPRAGFEPRPGRCIPMVSEPAVLPHFSAFTLPHRDGARTERLKTGAE